MKPAGKRIAYIVSMKRGLPVFTHREVKLLREQGEDVRLYVMRDGKGVAMPEPGWPVTRLAIFGVMWAHLLACFGRSGLYWKSFAEAVRDKTLVHFAEAVFFAREMKRDGIEVMYCFEGKHALWIAYFAQRFYDVPIVVLVHAEMVTAKERFDITRRAAEKCASIITISEFNKRGLIEKYGIPEEKIEVVRLFSPYKPEKRIQIMIVGEWSYRKGHETVLDAFEKMDPNRYGLWVVGGTAWYGEFYDVEAEVKKRNLSDRVILWGRVSDETLQLLFQSCDIFTLPSRTTPTGVTEGIPVAIMEAMSCGKPVVSTYHTGIPELVEEILVEEDNPEQLRAALERLGEDAALRDRLGKRNLEIIRERYSSANVERIAEILRQVTQ